MTPELVIYYESRLAMFQSDGWKDFVIDVRAMVDSTDRLDGVTTETLAFKQGELSIMNWILRLQETSKTAYADLSVSLPDGASIAENDAVGSSHDTD